MFMLEDQLVLNVQLERSSLAKEFCQLFHEVNHFHHTSLMIHSILPFHFTLPIKPNPASTIHFYTSDKPVCDENIEAFYALLLFQDPSFYLRAEKASTDSLLARFVELASPFTTFEAMSVLLGVPIEKVFALALSLQASNTAVILLSLSKHTHFVNTLGLHYSRLLLESRAFEARFKDYGSLLNLLAVFSNAPSLDAVFAQHSLIFTPTSPFCKLIVCSNCGGHS